MAVPIAQLVIALGPTVLRGLGAGIKWLVSSRHRGELRDGKATAAQLKADQAEAMEAMAKRPVAHLIYLNGFWYWKGRKRARSGGFALMPEAAAEARRAGFVVVDLESYLRALSQTKQD